MSGPRAIYSPAINAYRRVCPDPEVYITPKSRIPALRKHVGCPLIAVEDITKTPTWLWLNEAVREGTRLVYDRASRYYKVGSDKSRRLSRLAEIGTVALVDIVPFCEHRKYLYMPWRYVSRSILGYAHFYAFTGGHAEEVDGRIVHSHDVSLLVGKIAPHVAECHPRSLARRETLPIVFTRDEQSTYLSLREKMFAKYKTPQPILTRLADLSHGFETRRTIVASLLRPGDAVICNLASYAREYARRVPGIRAGTYAKPPAKLAECQRLVFAEPPIVMTYKRIDIESELPPGATVVEVVGDTKVDRFLCGRVGDELREIDTFQEALRARLSSEERA